MLILGFLLFVLGAFVGYMSGYVYSLLNKEQPSAVQLVKTKALGLGLFLVGVFIILKYLR